MPPAGRLPCHVCDRKAKAEPARPAPPALGGTTRGAGAAEDGSGATRAGNLVVNGVTTGITFPTTTNWTTWTTLNVNITLNNNTSNTIQLASTGQDLANVDEITVP